MYKHRNVISAIILTFFLTSLFYLTAGSNVLSFIGSFTGDSFSKMKRVERLIDKYYIDDYDKDKMQDAALESYVASLGDKYSDYISKEEFDSYQTMVTGDYEGIGVEVYIDDDNLITVDSVYENSPAAKSGIMVGDKLINADGVDISYDNYSEALKIIKGAKSKSDTVKIIVQRNGEKIEINVKREKISLNYVKSEKIDDLYYIALSSFEGKSAAQFQKALDETKKSGSKGLIIDLRNNPGGTLETVLDIADDILDKGVILTIKSKNGSEKVYKADDEKSFNIPICILVNSNTASAAEVLTAALSDNKKATVVGTKTYGKGVVQSIFMLGDSSALKITASKYYTPNNICINKIGITPDIVVEQNDEYKNSPVSSIPHEEDTQLKKAIEVLSK